MKPKITKWFGWFALMGLVVLIHPLLTSLAFLGHKESDVEGLDNNLSGQKCVFCHWLSSRNIFSGKEQDSGSNFIAAAVPWNGVSLGGYASKVSLVLGDTIDFHISTDMEQYEISIWREGNNRSLVAQIGGLSGTVYSCQGKYAEGCGWPVAYTLTVPETWVSGIYTVDIPTRTHGVQEIVFSVRQNNPGSTSKALFLSSVNTYNAYTPFGGKSLYFNNSSNGEKSFKVSFDRPLGSEGIRRFNLGDKNFSSWAGREGLTFEYATTYDLEFTQNLLSSYEVVVIAGHSEYWSWNMRQAIKAFVANGGRFMNLSGNTMWWQVRFEDNGRSLVCYKKRKMDPGKSREEVTYNPWDYPIYDAEYSLTGVQWRSGGYFHIGGHHSEIFPRNQGYGGYWVQNAEHWVFDGVGLRDGDVFGRNNGLPPGVMGLESDGVGFNCASDGKTILGPSVNMGTPSNFAILGISPVSSPNLGADSAGRHGTAVMGIYTLPNGGAVFSAGTTGWAKALGESQVSRVTRNVFDRFLANNFPQELAKNNGKNYLFYDAFNCNKLPHDGISPSNNTNREWYDGMPEHNYVYALGDLDALAYTPYCGVANGAGLKINLSGDRYIELSSQVKPNWGSTEVLYTRMFLNFSNLVMANNNTFTLMRQGPDYRINRTSANAMLSVSYNANKFQIVFKAGKADAVEISSVVPSRETFLLETMLDKRRNSMALCVDGICYNKDVDLSAIDQINRVDLLISKVDADTKGYLCLDEFAFHNTRINDSTLE